jgi:predicted nucleic acid-binding protein
MTVPIVCDASHLITFARAERFDLLSQVVGFLLIPDAVRDEITVRGRGMPGAREVEEATWITSLTVEDAGWADRLPAALGAGEKEAIALARQLGAYLLADDPAARREARKRGIPLTSTLDVLDEAKDCQLLDLVKPTLDDLLRTGFRLARSLYDAKLRRAGELP